MKTIYQCDQCDFQSVNRYHCIQHKEAIHELVKNLCDQYDFQNRIPKCLKNGIKRVKHDKIRHQCRKCNSSYVYRSSLSIHIKTKTCNCKTLVPMKYHLWAPVPPLPPSLPSPSPSVATTTDPILLPSSTALLSVSTFLNYLWLLFRWPQRQKIHLFKAYMPTLWFYQTNKKQLLKVHDLPGL
jgi:hypothetical protein